GATVRGDANDREVKSATHIPIRAHPRNYAVSLFTGPAMAAAISRAAVSRLGQLAIRADTGLGEPAPEQSFAGTRHGWIRLRPHVLALPVQCRAQARALRVETIGYITHAAPPAAARMARFTATRASWIFCWLLPRLRAAETAASAAALAVACVMALPGRVCAASLE